MNVRCWNCSQDFEVTTDSLRNAYDLGYRKGMDDLRSRLEDYRREAEREDGQ